MTSQISDLYLPTPAPKPRSAALPAMGILAGALAIGTAAAWLFNRVRQRPLADRTRDRLAPPTFSEAAPRVVPNASDIHVA